MYSSWKAYTLKIELIKCPETSIDKYQHTLRNMAKEQRPQLHCSGGLKSHDFRTAEEIPTSPKKLRSEEEFS